MTKLIFEIGCEELPANSLVNLSNQLLQSWQNQTKQLKLDYSSANVLFTPRRLVLEVDGIALNQQSTEITKQGPFVSQAFENSDLTKPKNSALGFAKSCEVDIKQLQLTQTPKGDRLIFQQTIKGKPSLELLPEILKKCCQISTNQSMRWGEGKRQFLRPVRWLLAMIDDKIIHLNEFGLSSSNQTFGHRFMSAGAITINHSKNYREILKSAYVIVNQQERQQLIVSQLAEIAKKHSVEINQDPQLLAEVNALVEYPKALLGEFDADFLKLPNEVLITTMKVHQRYFYCTKNGVLDNSFIMIANLISEDERLIINGNQRVLEPRLRDARFFYDQDLKLGINNMVVKLQNVVYETNLGSLAIRIERIQRLLKLFCQDCLVDESTMIEAAKYCKADLVSAMVGEFENTQGTMAAIYANQAGVKFQTTKAIGEHYYPRFSKDILPTTREGVLLSLADKLEQIIMLFAIGKKPSTDKDPYGLRRACVGCVRLLLDGGLIINICKVIKTFIETEPLLSKLDCNKQQLFADVLNFLIERLKVILSDEYSPQTVASIIKPSALYWYQLRYFIDSLQQNLDNPQFQDFQQALKRVTNILKSKTSIPDSFDPKLLNLEAEQQLAGHIAKLDIIKPDEQYLTTICEITELLNRFFDDVVVFVPEQNIQTNRLSLLSATRKTLNKYIDFSQLA